MRENNLDNLNVKKITFLKRNTNKSTKMITSKSTGMHWKRDVTDDTMFLRWLHCMHACTCTYGIRNRERESLVNAL